MDLHVWAYFIFRYSSIQLLAQLLAIVL